MLTQTDFSVSCVRAESHQLFFLFSGTGLRPAGVHTVDVVGQTAIGDRNIAIVRDPHDSCYEHGFSDEFPGLAGIVNWQRREIATRFAHVRDVFSAGVSAGGIVAVQTAHHIGARAAWSFAGRLIKPEAVEERLRLTEQVYQRTLGRTRLGALSAADAERLDEAFSTPELQDARWRLVDNPDTVVARDRLHRLVEEVNRGGVSLPCHFYYAVTNAIDRECAEAFAENPNVTLHPLKPGPGDLTPRVGFSEPDHSVIPILKRRGELAGVFAGYL